jgi:hypothetical protein
MQCLGVWEWWRWCGELGLRNLLMLLYNIIWRASLAVSMCASVCRRWSPCWGVLPLAWWEWEYGDSKWSEFLFLAVGEKTRWLMDVFALGKVTVWCRNIGHSSTKSQAVECKSDLHRDSAIYTFSLFNMLHSLHSNAVQCLHINLLLIMICYMAPKLAKMTVGCEISNTKKKHIYSTTETLHI